MSWQASSWAKSTRGHATIAEKAVLMMLAEYAHPETAECFPTQRRIADDLECTVKTVQRSLDTLEAAGFVTVLNKGNQYRSTHYRLNLEVVHATAPMSPAQIHAGDIYAQPDPPVAKVKATNKTSESDILAIVTNQELTSGGSDLPSSKSSTSPQSDRAPAAPPPVLRERFFGAAHNGVAVGVIVELWDRPLSKEQRAVIGANVRSSGHGLAVWDAAVAAASKVDPAQYFAKVLNEGKKNATPRRRTAGDTGQFDRYAKHD